MQSVLLKVDESINLTELVTTIQSIYGNQNVEPVVKPDTIKTFGALPEIFSKPLPANNFRIYNREELNERCYIHFRYYKIRSCQYGNRHYNKNNRG